MIACGMMQTMYVVSAVFSCFSSDALVTSCQLGFTNQQIHYLVSDLRPESQYSSLMQKDAPTDPTSREASWDWRLHDNSVDESKLRLVHSGHLDLSDFMEVNGRRVVARWGGRTIKKDGRERKRTGHHAQHRVSQHLLFDA